MELPGNDYDSDDLSALDFSGGGTDVEESSLDALGDYAPPTEVEDAETGLDALEGLTEQDEDEELALFTVTNPQGSVSVTALMDGRVQNITITDKASSMSETALAEEIFVIADLARQKARAAQHTFMVESMSEIAGRQLPSRARCCTSSSRAPCTCPHRKRRPHARPRCSRPGTRWTTRPATTVIND